MHTPGPWRINKGERGSFYVTAGNDTAVAQTYEPNQAMARLTGAPDPEANAALIVAAPDMLEAIKDYLRIVADVPNTMKISKADTEKCRAAFRAAISKTEAA